MFQFREVLGLLGMDTVSFLSDKIFEIIDKDKDDFVILNKI